MEEDKPLPLHEAAQQLLDRLNHFGNIDPVRDEGPIEDLRVALDNHPKLS